MLEDEIVLYALHDKDKKNNDGYEKLTFFLCYQDHVNNGEMILGTYKISENDLLEIDIDNKTDYKYQIVVLEMMKEKGLLEIWDDNLELDIETMHETMIVDNAWQKAINYIKESDIEMLVVEQPEKSHLKVY